MLILIWLTPNLVNMIFSQKQKLTKELQTYSWIVEYYKGYKQYPYVLDFWKIKLEKSSLTNWMFSVCVACQNHFWNWFLQFVELFQAWFFKSQVQMDRASVSESIQIWMQPVFWHLDWFSPTNMAKKKRFLPNFCHNDELS